MIYGMLVRRRNELMREIRALRTRHRRRKIYFIELRNTVTAMLKWETSWLRVARKVMRQRGRRHKMPAGPSKV